jgi:hypothetical protein
MERPSNLSRNVAAVLLAAAYGFAAEPDRLPALNHQALVYREAGDYVRARQAAERALGIVEAQKLTETVERANVFANLGGIAEMQGETAVAETLNDLALAYSREGGSIRRVHCTGGHWGFWKRRRTRGICRRC